MADTVNEEVLDEVTVEDTSEPSFLGLTKDDIGTIVLRAIVSTLVMTGIRIIEKKAHIAIEQRNKANDTGVVNEPIDATATEN